MSAWKPLHGYEMVVGLEVHVELKTRTKAFCRCKTDYGAPPNTQCCEVCMGYPGALPFLNREAVHYAALAGMALNCTVHEYSRFDRKNYFYPDLPKGYQITQFDFPLCTGGHVVISTPDGEKTIGITRIHMEEDAGKLLHVEGGTLLDGNRCGVPLIEIVSEPDISAPQEAVEYLRKLRQIIAYTGVSDCKMQEGSLRCDVNLSVRLPGQPMGTRTEMKNLNSFSAVEKAIEAEYRRQVLMQIEGEAVCQETRRLDARTGETVLMRRKENADDYRYFPEPDLTALRLSKEELSLWERELPEMPDIRKARYMKEYGLSAQTADKLTVTRKVAEYFEKVAGMSRDAALMANLMVGEVFRLMDGEDGDILLSEAALSQIADMAAHGDISQGSAKKVIAELWGREETPAQCVERLGLKQISDPELLRQLVQQAMAEHPDLLEGYRKGKLSLKNALMGAAMALSDGKANPVLMRQELEQALEEE